MSARLLFFSVMNQANGMKKENQVTAYAHEKATLLDCNIKQQRISHTWLRITLLLSRIKQWIL